MVSLESPVRTYAHVTSQVQVTGAWVDVPVGTEEDVLTKDKSRVFFRSVMRDISGSCDVQVLEAGALALSGAKDKEEFLSLLAAGDLQFAPCTVRCLRRVKDSYVNAVSSAAAFSCIACVHGFCSLAQVKTSAEAQRFI